MDLSALRQFFGDVRKAASPCLEIATSYVRRIVSRLCARMQGKVAAAIKQNPMAPVLVCYSSDGWGVKLRDAVITKYGEYKVCREGTARAEFALERGFVLIRAQGQDTLYGLLSQPRIMNDGRCASNFVYMSA